MGKLISMTLLSMFCGFVFCQEPPSVEGLLKKAESAKDADKIDLYKQIAFVYLPGPQFDSALYYYRLCMDIAEKTGNEKEIANAYNNTGLVLRVQGKHEQATEALFKALALYEKNGLAAESSKALTNLSFVYKEQGNFDEAIRKLTQAIVISEKANDTVTLINLYGELSDNYNQADNLKEAVIAINKGKIFFDEKTGRPANSQMDSMKMIYTKSFFNNVMAVVRTREGNFAEADRIYRQEWEDSKKYNMSPLNKFDILGGRAHNFYQAGKYDSALLYSDMAWNIIKENSLPMVDIKFFELRTNIFEKLGRFKEAFEAQHLSRTANDSLNNEKAGKALAVAQTKYETEKKDIQIVALNKQKKFQKLIIGLASGAFILALGFMLFAYRSKKLQKKLYEQREELLIKEKEIEMNALQKKMTELEQMALRAQMNPHFIFNSLNAVQHFVMNKDVEGVNKYLGAFSHLVRQTLNNSGRQVISLDEEIKYLDTYLSLEKMKSNDRFAYNINVDNSIDRYSTFIPGMILQPFVENSIRHGVAYQDNNAGEISISVSKNGKLVCKIEDNGIGREKAGEKKRTVVSPEFESKGMSITMSRIDTINKLYGADISAHVEDIVDAEGGVAGTRVTVDFPTDLE